MLFFVIRFLWTKIANFWLLIFFEKEKKLPSIPFTLIYSTCPPSNMDTAVKLIDAGSLKDEGKFQKEDLGVHEEEGGLHEVVEDGEVVFEEGGVDLEARAKGGEVKGK